MRLAVEELAEKLLELGASSVFLYGSRARGEELPDSDWELGAIFEDQKYMERKELAKLSPKGVVIYPFRLLEFESGKPETPFTRSIWLNEIIKTGKTIAGKLIVEKQSPPEITKKDLKNDISFSKARALDAMLALRIGSDELAKDLFVKSCLFGLRDLILVSGGEFPSSYHEIAKESAKYLPEKFAMLPQICLAVRSGHERLTQDLTFQNISLFTEVIESKIRL